MTGCEVQFGEGLLHPQNNAFRLKIQELADQSLSGPLYVDTVFAIDRRASEQPEQPEPFSRPFCCVVLDLHRLFLLHPPLGMRSVARFVMDAHISAGETMLPNAIQAGGYRFLYPLESLEILSTLWRRESSKIGVVDFSTAEVSFVEGQDYPEMSAARNPLALAAPARTLELDDSPADSNWRTGNIPDLADLTTRYVGIIREEYLRFTSVSIPCGTSRVLWDRGRESTSCGGIGAEPEEALAIARCEAIERFQAIFVPDSERLVYARHTALPAGAAVDPKTLFFTSPGPMYWALAKRAFRSGELFVPAQEIWLGTRRLPGENMRILPTTNGCALGGSVSEASLFAILELIERDAFLVMWYLRHAPAKIDLGSIEYEPVQLLLARIRSRMPGYRIHVFDIRTEIPIPAVAAVAVREHGSGPKTLHAAAARLSLDRAVFSALKDLAMSFDSINDRKPPSPNSIHLPEDHRAFYAADENFSKLSFLDFDSPGAVTSVDVNRANEAGLGAILAQIGATLEQLGLPVLLKDITHPFSARRGLFCVKAVIPGLFPMWYGHRHVRFSITERLRNLAAQRLGKETLMESDVNLEMHPFG
ncbi:MAG TPA: YcaO-like family protein [Bryobacteraceae bacterium]